PSQGDLVIDVDYPTGSFSGGNVGQMDVQNSLAGRVFASSMYPVANGTTANHGPVVEVGYVPASGLYAIFGSDVQTGSSPLTVTFQDNSYSSDPGGVTSWAWDFDNDGTVDSTLQNPVHTYTACGVYDVKLTVGDASHSPSSVTRTAFIRTDDITAAFDDQVVGALAMQFSDRSSGPATAWTWDLDGDGITDSTLPNPTWAYPNHDPVDVTLTASRLCGGSDTITRTIVPALAIQTTFAGGATGAAGSTMLFDVDVTNPLGVKVTGLDVHVAGGSGVGFSVEVHLTSAGHAGKETVADAWLLAGTATGTTAGAGVRTTMNLGAPIYLPPGHYGMALHHLGAAPAFTVGTGSNQDYHGADLALHLGTHRSTAPNQPFGAGASTAARVWNGALRYQRCQLSGAGGYGFLGEGCAGSLGVPRLTPINDPRLGQTLQVMVDRLPAMTALMFTGVSSSTSPLGPLPLDTTALGAPGCFLRASPDVGLLISGASSTAQWNLAIPSSPALACALFFQQAVVFDPGHNAAGAVASNAAGFVVGN
ncbi:MAG: PKD domain-containing protein, partial [Planctomycetes bacterium]|nr:PKD domain-containing protein [Planctomycetota bacterium]